MHVAASLFHDIAAVRRSSGCRACGSTARARRATCRAPASSPSLAGLPDVLDGLVPPVAWVGVEPRWTRTGFDDEKIEQGVRLILEGIGEDPDRGGLRETPARVARMYREVFAGIGQDASQLVTVVEGADHDEMIMVRDIPLLRMCEHHLIPFSGKAHVAYIPNKAQQITGLSKIARVVDLLAKRPQVQERLTTRDRRGARRARS